MLVEWAVCMLLEHRNIMIHCWSKHNMNCQQSIISHSEKCHIFRNSFLFLYLEIDNISLKCISCSYNISLAESISKLTVEKSKFGEWWGLIHVHFQKTVHFVQTPSFIVNILIYQDSENCEINNSSGVFDWNICHSALLRSTHQALLFSSNGQPWSFVSANLKVILRNQFYNLIMNQKYF